MNILLVLNRPKARNVSVVIRIPGRDHQKRFKGLMDKRQFRDAFDFAYSRGEMQQYLHPDREILIKAPVYTLVEDLIVHWEKKRG